MNFCLRSIFVFIMILLPQVVKADMGIMDWILFSDKKYAKHIEVKAFILTQEQACKALCEPEQDPIQLDKKALSGKTKYLFLMVKNLGKKHAWGTLACRVPGYHVPIKVPIFDINSQKYNLYLIHLGLLGFVSKEGDFPEISIEWDRLYTK